MQKLSLNLEILSKSQTKNKKLKLSKKDKKEKEKKKIDIKELNFLQLLETKKQNPKNKINLPKKSQKINTNNKSILEEVTKNNHINKLLQKSYKLLDSKNKIITQQTKTPELPNKNKTINKFESHISLKNHLKPQKTKGKLEKINKLNKKTKYNETKTHLSTKELKPIKKIITHVAKLKTHNNSKVLNQLSGLETQYAKSKTVAPKIESLTQTSETTNYKTMETIKTQLQNSITYMSQNNKKQVVLKLTPEHLGKLEINISMIKKSTKVEIKVQKHETLELLQNNQTSLKNLFSEIKKTSNNISFSFEKNTNSQSNSNSKQQKRKKYQEIEEKFNYLENETISSYVGLIEIIV